jgi:hypothetical protein
MTSLYTAKVVDNAPLSMLSCSFDARAFNWNVLTQTIKAGNYADALVLTPSLRFNSNNLLNVQKQQINYVTSR